MEPSFCSQFIRDTGVKHKLIASIKIFADLKSWEREHGGGEENMGGRRRKDQERGRGEEGERMIGVDEGREGWFLAKRVQEIN